MKISIVIPARYESSRFPGKPLVQLRGKSMIQRVYEICSKTIGAENTYIATDDTRIKNHCNEKNMNCIMTPKSCLTGTDRVYQASLKIDSDILINVQGDEPLINPDDILAVIKEAKNNPNKIINAMGKIDSEEAFNSPTVPKVTADLNGRLLYMSRAGIPLSKKGQFVSASRQVCIYSFPKDALEKFYNYGRKTPLENIEDIEILRFLELGYEVKMVEVCGNSIAIDTKEDAEKVIEILKRRESV
jgi:3-deoxy-manno-octulosonate cytidylyltransferase (CMP-KDO synthetase)